MTDAEKAIQDFLDALERLRDVPEAIRRVFNEAANSLLARVILRIAQDIISVAEWFLEMAQKLLDKILEYLRGCWAPVYFIKASFGWADIQTKANNLNAGITASSLSLGSWQGTAADNYRGAKSAQAPAAARVASMSGSMRSALFTTGGAGLAFYAALTAAALNFIGEVATELVAAATVFGAIPAAVAGVASSLKGILIILGLGAAIVALINSQASHIQALNVEGDSGNGFDGGKWPKATVSGAYDDATVWDGDADWSVKPA